MTAEELVKAILEKAGTIDNVTSVFNCMTRLRLTVKDDSAVDEEGLKAIDGVLGVIHDRERYMEIVVGPGLSAKCGDICRQMGIPSAVNEWKENKAAIQASGKESRLRGLMKIFGEIFVPLIPGVIASGLCAGLNILLQQIFPGWEDNAVLCVLCPLLGLIHTSFLTYMTAWTGYRAAERFGGTPILGGMLGLITILEGINTVSQNTGMWNSELPLESILRSGRGGILAVVFGVIIMVRVEKWIRAHMPSSLDVVFTPLLTLLVCLIPYLLGVGIPVATGQRSRLPHRIPHCLLAQLGVLIGHLPV
jgi:PTS system sucrose-specific IIC component